MSRPPLTSAGLFQPAHNVNVVAGAVDAFWQPCRDDGSTKLQTVSRMRIVGSLLTNVFNRSWAIAGDAWEAGEIDSYAMIHSDIEAETGWLDILHEELLATDADVISAVVPMKCLDGLCSMGVEGVNPWLVPRLTVKQVRELPATFTDEDVGGELLLNTGLWLCRLGPWLDNVHFRQQDKIEKVNGKRTAFTMSEDWDFSRQCRSQGLKLAATSRVKLLHTGTAWWSNQAGGGWDYDQGNGDALAKLKVMKLNPVAKAG